MLTVRKYSEWADTATTMHMILQMMGKVKLMRMHSQPEWNHTLLALTPHGFTTGLIPHGETSFDIEFNCRESTVSARCTTGMRAGFPVRGTQSVSDYFATFTAMLRYIGHDTRINRTPQEMAITTPFDKLTDATPFDMAAARDYFDTCVFAHNALLAFASPFRGKKMLPSLFWGTFDMTTVLFSGVEKPFGGEGLIEQVAFDEQFVEFGFWPGDAAVEEPSFFILPYPFLTEDYAGTRVAPEQAHYSPEKKEYFLALRDVLTHDDPAGVVCRFCREAYAAITKAEGWPNAEWFTRPLLC